MDQPGKAAAFKALHERAGVFVIPNASNAGEARILASFGFAALATTSAGMAFALGRKDGAVSRDEALANAGSIVEATELPVSADLENGFSDDPQEVAKTIRLAAEIGVVGGSIEDASGNPEQPIYEMQHAVSRVAAAAQAVRALPFPFVLVGRAENYLHGRPDLDDTIARLRAYETAGADVLFAPGLPDLEAIRSVLAAVSKPLNVIAGLKGSSYTLAELGDIGVRRVSLGSSLARASMAAFVRAAEEVREKGTFTYADEATPSAAANAFMKGRTQ
jgi:2-methylisocitrate lyase-like PEP mutase family enzyme